nr:MAG: hypothetical protein [Bacteriophage sp.]
MPKFVDIASLSEKTLDGSEAVQVSATQKARLVQILTQLGDNLEMAVNSSESWQLPDFDTSSTPVQNWLNALAFACGLRDESTGWGPFRIVNGNDGDIAYFVLLWYDNINDLTEAFVIGSYKEKVITLYEKSGKQHLTPSGDQDNAVIQDIISTGGWTKVVTINADSSTIKQTYGTNTQFLAPVQGSETLLTTTVERILYALGFRGTNTNFRFLTGVNSTSETYWGVAFYNAGQSKTFTVLFGIGGSSLPVGMYQKSGNVTAQKSMDSEFIQDVLSTWTKSWSLNRQGTIYTSDVIAATSDKPITLPGQFAFPSLTDLKTDAFVKQMIYNSGYHQSNACFRQLIASYVIGGTGSQVQCYYGVTWYNSCYGRTYTMLVNMELANGEYITLYQKQGRHIESNPTDAAYVLDVLTGNWLKVAGIGTGGSEPTPIESLAAEKVNVAAPTLYNETTASTWQPDAANNLQELLNGLLYRTGLRSTSDGLNLGFRVVCAGGKIAIIANDSSSSDYSVFLFSGGSTIHTYLIDQTYVMEWVVNYSSDQEIINSIENDGSETGMLDMAGISNFATKAYVKPNDAVLTMFPSGYRTVIPGENLTTNLTSGTLKIKVPDLLTAQVKAGPFRDAVIDVPYGVTVQFADQVEILYKADGVDNFTATSGRKVYTIHYVPTTSSTANITFRAFVNVANYK